MTTDAHALAAIVLAICWFIFLLFWIVSAFFTKRTSLRQGLGESLGYRVFAVLGCLVLFNARRLPPAWGTHFAPPTDLLAWWSALLGVTGLAICLWARITLGRNWSSVVMVKEGHELVQRGPYRYVRHPIYTRLLAMFAGNVLLEGRWAGLLGIALLFLSFWIKLRHEESVMLKEFPADYPGYMKRVKRLIPFVL